MRSGAAPGHAPHVPQRRRHRMSCLRDDRGPVPAVPRVREAPGLATGRELFRPGHLRGQPAAAGHPDAPRGTQQVQAVQRRSRLESLRSDQAATRRTSPASTSACPSAFGHACSISLADRPHPTSQADDHSRAPARGGGSAGCPAPPDAATANAPESLMLFQVASIQPSERWACAMRNASMWPLKGSAMPVTRAPGLRGPGSPGPS